MSRLRDVVTGPPGRFLLAGGANTLATFALYLLLLQVLPYAAAYSLAFLAGIALAYVLNRVFVFRAPGSAATVVLFPLVYVVQYLLGLAVVFFWVDVLGLPAQLASLAAVVLTIPVTFLLSRRLFLGRPVPRA